MKNRTENTLSSILVIPYGLDPVLVSPEGVGKPKHNVSHDLSWPIGFEINISLWIAVPDDKILPSSSLLGGCNGGSCKTTPLVSDRTVEQSRPGPPFFLRCLEEVGNDVAGRNIRRVLSPFNPLDLFVFVIKDIGRG